MGSRGITALTTALVVTAIILLALAVGLTIIQANTSSSTSTRQNSSLTNSTSSSNSSTSIAGSANSASAFSQTTTNNVSTSSSSIGGAKLVSYNDPAYDSIYDSFNGYVYLLNSNNQMQLIFPSNGSIVTLSSNSGQALGYNTTNGKAYDLYIENDIGCDVGYVYGYNGTSSASGKGLGSGLSGSSLLYNSHYHYLAFAAGAYNDDPVFGGCGAGLYVWADNSSFSYVYTGPKPSGSFPGWYGYVPELAYNSINGDMYVPVLNYSTSNPQTVIDATYLYTVRGFTTLASNSTLEGITQRLVFDPANQYIYAEQFFTSNHTTSLVALNVTSGQVIGSISLKDNSSIVYDSQNQMIYAFGKNQISEISNVKIVQTYKEPTAAPTSALYDSKDNQLIDFYSSKSRSATTTTELSTLNPLFLIVAVVLIERLRALDQYLITKPGSKVTFQQLSQVYQRFYSMSG